jgi:hypothetical protein
MFSLLRHGFPEPLIEVNFRFVPASVLRRRHMSRVLFHRRVSRAAQVAAVALSFLFIFAIVALARDAPALDAGPCAGHSSGT